MDPTPPGTTWHSSVTLACFAAAVVQKEAAKGGGQERAGRETEDDEDEYPAGDLTTTAFHSTVCTYRGLPPSYKCSPSTGREGTGRKRVHVESNPVGNLTTTTTATSASHSTLTLTTSYKQALPVGRGAGASASAFPPLLTSTLWGIRLSDLCRVRD